MDIESLLKLLRENAVEYVIIGAFAFRLADLIEMKAAAGRPKDLEDLKYLRELKARRDQGPTE